MSDIIEIYKKYVEFIINKYKISNKDQFRLELADLIKKHPEENDKHQMEMWNAEHSYLILKYTTLTKQELNDMILSDYQNLKESAQKIEDNVNEVA